MTKYQDSTLEKPFASLSSAYLYMDLLFCLLFLCLFYLYYMDHVLLLPFLVAIALSYYPLAIYISQCHQSEKRFDQSWNHLNENLPIFYACSRFSVAACTFIVVLIDHTNIDLWNAISHTPLHSLVLLGVMCALLLALLSVGVLLQRRHFSIADSHVDNSFQVKLAQADELFFVPPPTAALGEQQHHSKFEKHRPIATSSTSFLDLIYVTKEYNKVQKKRERYSEEILSC